MKCAPCSVAWMCVQCCFESNSKWMHGYVFWCWILNVSRGRAHTHTHSFSIQISHNNARKATIAAHFNISNGETTHTGNIICTELYIIRTVCNFWFQTIFLFVHWFLAFLMPTAALVAVVAVAYGEKDMFQKCVHHGHKVVQIMKIEIQIKICILHRIEIDMSFFTSAAQTKQNWNKQSGTFFGADVCATAAHKLL